MTALSVRLSATPVSPDRVPAVSARPGGAVSRRKIWAKTRRRRVRKKARRAVAGCVVVVAGCAVFLSGAGQAGYLARWLVLVVLVLLAVPVAVLAAPRRWRAAYRHWEHRPFFWAPVWARACPVGADSGPGGPGGPGRRPAPVRGGAVSAPAGCRPARRGAGAGWRSITLCRGRRAAATVRRNLVLLCQFHNDVKSNYSVDRDGYRALPAVHGDLPGR